MSIKVDARKFFVGGLLVYLKTLKRWIDLIKGFLSYIDFNFFCGFLSFLRHFLKFSNLGFSLIFLSKSGVSYGYLDKLQIDFDIFWHMMHVPKMTPYAPKMPLKLAILGNLKSKFFRTWPITCKQGVIQQKVLKDLWSVCLGLPTVKIWGQLVMLFQS